MKTTEKYNGWTNYETWIVNLWIDESSSSYVIEMAEEILEIETDRDDAVYIFAQNLEEMHEEEMELLNIPNSVFSDLLRASLKEVNWMEIAEHIIEDVEQEMREA